MKRININLTNDYRVNYFIGSVLTALATFGVGLIGILFVLSGAETLRGFAWRVAATVISVALVWAYLSSLAASMH